MSILLWDGRQYHPKIILSANLILFCDNCLDKSLKFSDNV